MQKRWANFQKIDAGMPISTRYLLLNAMNDWAASLNSNRTLTGMHPFLVQAGNLRGVRNLDRELPYCTISDLISLTKPCNSSACRSRLRLFCITSAKMVLNGATQIQ